MHDFRKCHIYRTNGFHFQRTWHDFDVMNQIQNNLKGQNLLRNIVNSVLLGCELCLATTPVCAASELPIGKYVRFTRSPSFPPGGQETGNLQIIESSNLQVKFSLTVTMNPKATDDGFHIRNGVIEEGSAFKEGGSIIYRSNNPEDKELGTCVLNFQSSGSDVVVAQSGKCWWFGEDVDASGHYRRAKNDEELGVR